MYFLCTGCKKEITSPAKPVWLCNCGMPLEVHYSWEGKVHNLDVDETELSLWRYSSVLPNVKNNITLGEGHTPLFPIGENIFVKDETVNPTGSFKDRGMALAVTMAKARAFRIFVCHQRVMQEFLQQHIARKLKLNVMYIYLRQFPNHLKKRQKNINLKYF